jgi:hypothetical protein
MGLDMYLTKRVYVGAYYNHNNIMGEINLTKGKDNIPIKINLKRVSEITERIGYWRKANQIHRWFVENVQGGKDDCGEYYVSEEHLRKLLEACNKVKQNNKSAADLLPTASGFFFGGTDYDEYYLEEIDDTIEIIETIFKEKCDNEYIDGDIYYQSSW